MIKKWLVIKYLIFVLVVCCQVKSFSQNLETTRAFAYDRGMISASEPFAPTGNPALLSLKNNLRFNLEYYHTNTDNYSISLTYPLTYAVGTRTGHDGATKILYDNFVGYR